MIYNTSHWSCCPNIPTDQPLLASKTQNAGGQASVANIIHKEMPKKFFLDYKTKIG